MKELKEKKCVPCEGGVLPLNAAEIEKYKQKLKTEWEVVENKKIRKKFPFENFKTGLAFAGKVGVIAEEENHHPDIYIHFRNVEIELSTHAIDGLSENDFILAAKIDDVELD